MKSSQSKIEILLLIILAMIPLLWLRPGYVVANGDSFPSWLNPRETLESDFYLYSQDYLGLSSSLSSSVLYGTSWVIFDYLGFAAYYTQIFFQILLFLVAGLSTYFLSKAIYPKLKFAPLISGVFYMFNLVDLQTRLNIGFTWAYAFLPMVMVFFVRSINIEAQRDHTTAGKNIILFALSSTITLSIASMNLAIVVLIIADILILLVFYLMIYRKQIRTMISVISKTTALTLLFNVWWTIPIINYFLLAPSVANPGINIIAWSWTQARSSFLNLFWLNGNWGWRQEYVPYIDYYANPIIVVLSFVPFMLASSALLYKDKKSSFNAYAMLIVLTFLFLAKGVHEPLSGVNISLYTYIPTMIIFREPTSKFTLALMPFLALLIGYAAHHIISMKQGENGQLSHAGKTALVFIMISLILVSLPLVINPLETRTAQLPFSSYVRIPDYWNEATDWLNNQSGYFTILITPPQDFYQTPYTWGYYGAEFAPRLIQAPVILDTYGYSYKFDLETETTQGQLYDAIRYNRTDEFKAFLDLLNIKYVLQRNDLETNFTGRDIMSASEMQDFLLQQPYIELTRRFGSLDIYQYMEAKPFALGLDDTTLQRIAIEIENVSVSLSTWNFSSVADLEEWQKETPQNQFGANQTLSLDDGTLKAELSDSTWGWKTIDSPLIPSVFGRIIDVQTDVRGVNTEQAHVKISEYDANKTILTSNYAVFVNDGTFNWTHIAFTYKTGQRDTRYVQLQVWHGHETKKTLPNRIWIDNVQVKEYVRTLNTTGLELLFQNSTESQARILKYERVNPTRMLVTINATEPFTLVVAEALDPLWTASVNNVEYNPMQIYLGLSGFNINQTGILDITVEYVPQRWFFYGSVISLCTFLVCMAYLTYDFTKTKMHSVKRLLQKLKLVPLALV